MTGPAPFVILDRDGVINADSFDYVKSVDEWQPIPGALDAIARLGRAGHDVVVATNQSGLGRGLFTAETLAAIHAEMQRRIEAAGGRLAGVFVCPHRPDEACGCRKPAPGLLEEIARVRRQPLAGVPFVGDKASDVDCALAAGAQPVLVLSGIVAVDVDAARRRGARVYRDLGEFVDAYLSR